jgi:N-acetylglucosamine-6-phosphate deacetylase
VGLVLSGTVARGGAVHEGWLEVEGEHIVSAGSGRPPRAADEHVDGVIAPGLCDLQVNGAAGAEVLGGAEAIARIDAAQLESGVTRYLATLVSPDEATARRALAVLAEATADPASPVAGVHVEGPFLAPAYAGMHPPARLRSPADGAPDWLTEPPVRLVTLAPELPGALRLIRELTAAGVAVAVGHSGADAATATAAIDAGATLVTHVFNAMLPLAHRSPGIAAVALLDDRVAASVIADGVHVDPLILELVRRAAGSRTVLVSDATPAAAAPAGDYAMAGVTISSAVAGGGARTADGRLAGSTVTLDGAVSRWVELTGATLAEALFAAAERPRRVLGFGTPLVTGAPADLVVVDAGGAVRRVMHRGRWREPRRRVR